MQTSENSPGTHVYEILVLLSGDSALSVRTSARYGVIMPLSVAAALKSSFLFVLLLMVIGAA